MLNDDSSPYSPEELNSKIPDAIIESFSPSPIPVEDSDSLMEEINIFLALDDSIPPGIENDNYDSEGGVLFLKNYLTMILFPFLTITTRSGVAYDRPTIPPTPSPLSKEVEHETEEIKDQGRGLKEKQHGSTSNTSKDIGYTVSSTIDKHVVSSLGGPTVEKLIASWNNNDTQEGNVGQCSTSISCTASLNKGNVPINVIDLPATLSNSDSMLSGPTSEDSLSVIATKLDIPLMLDSYTSDMCMQSWGRFYMCTIRVEFEWKPLKCSSCKVFGHVLEECLKNIVSNVVKNLKNHRQAARGVKVQNGGISKSAGKGANFGVSPSDHGFFHVSSSITSTTPIIERIDKLERQIIDRKLTLVDDDGNPLPKVVSTVNKDSDSEVEDVVDEHVVFMASTSLKIGNDSGYDTNSLLEQYRSTKWDDDYDPYDDDLYESHDMSENLQAICDDFDITVCGRVKK
ncbi:hypothetical protein Tco_0530283 [Tanacetum coccineum]